MIYDYFEEVKEDIKQYLRDNDYTEEDLNEDTLYDDLFIADSVTGNASGSYYCNTWKAEEALAHNLDLLGKALNEFCCDSNYLTEHGAEACDVTIRCYVLSLVLADAIDEYKEELKEV